MTYRQAFRALSIQAAKPKTKAQTTHELATKFSKVSLQKFPLVTGENYSFKKYRKITTINAECVEECLDVKPANYPSISAILGQTMSPESLAILKRWEQKKIKELGYDGFQEYKKNIFARGKMLHQNVENYLKTRDNSVLQFHNQTQENIWKSIEHVMPNIDTLYGTEFPVHHPILKYQGIIDCLASYHKVPTLFEWKSSEKLKPTLSDTYDNPLQAVAYFSCLQFDSVLRNAFSSSSSLDESSDSLSELPTAKEVILVIGYEDGSPANVHLLGRSHREQYWTLFMKRLEQFWALTAAK